MPLTPRFQRVAGARPFVDRERAVAVFEDELSAVGGGPRALNITGVGGIGKSRVMRELRARIAKPDRTALLDLQLPACREQESALAVLRRELGEQGVRFHRYDLAYAVLWQRLHPQLKLERKQLALIESSELLAQMLDHAASFPVFGTAVGLIKILESAPEKFRKWRWLRNDETLSSLDDLTNAQLSDAVTYLFAQDLRQACSDGSRCVIFIDAYDALVTGPERAGRAGALDSWLRDLVVQLDVGLAVIGSREPLGWDAYDADWSSVIRTLDLDDLPEPARLQLLEEGGLSDPQQRGVIAVASSGVPFYLNLALDSLHRNSSDNVASVVSPAEILQRFLQYVDPHDVRFLELLSVARTFDYEVFQEVARTYQLPANRLVWESVTAYSFVTSAGREQFQLHQLMVTALQARMSAELGKEVHELLHAVWSRRADAAEADGSDPVGPGIETAVREAVYHALYAGRITGPELLAHADRVVAAGATLGIGGIIADVENIISNASDAEQLGERPGAQETDVAKALRCLRAEAAVRQGDAPVAASLTADAGETVSTVVDARLSVAGAHARRILGETGEALRIYTTVWNHEDSPQRRVAGLWAADLHMAQGRFALAVPMAEYIRSSCGPADAELLGDACRLLHLAYRFSFDFPASARFLEEAEQAYSEAGSVIGQANIVVNRAELMAWTDPRAAVAAADKAVELQQEVGATHEIGKAYTAMALAQAAIGEEERAHAALSLACEALEKAGYRSGRARAELVRATILARQGRADPAERSARWAISEFQQAEVYPTLILMAQALLEFLGGTGAEVTAVAASARQAIQPVGTLRELESRMWQGMATHLGHVGDGPVPGVSAPLSLYLRARTSDAPAVGFYNNNVRLDTPDSPVIVRIPITGADEMDLRVWPEYQVLQAISPYASRVPRVLFAADVPAFQIHEFIEGDLLDNLAPRGIAVPPFVLNQVVDLFAQLATVPFDALPSLPDGWPTDGDCAGFAARLSDLTQRVWERFRAEYQPLYNALGVPAEPLVHALRLWPLLSSRPFRLLHCDVHRKNIIVRNQSATFLDWELALWGDPVYDLAVHFHKMAYQQDEQDTVLNAWLQALPSELTRNWGTDLGYYLGHERIKSVLVDSVRYAKIVRSSTVTEEHKQHLVRSLTGKLNIAGVVWGWRAGIDEDTVARALEA